MTDRFGRQKVYIADLACFVVLSALQFFATEPWQLIVLRTLMGVAVGADLAIAGTIASEFAPQKSRGPLLVAQCDSATVLWREIRAQGFASSLTNVQRFVHQLRHDGPSPTGTPRPALRKPNRLRRRTPVEDS